MIRSVLAGFLFLLALVDGASAQTCSVPNTLTNGTNADATQVMANFNAILTCLNNQPQAGVPRSYLAGLTLSTPGGSAGFGIASGVATSDDATTSMNLSTSSTKTTSAWAVGSGNGSLDTGSIANNTWYHVFLIERTDTGVVDVLISQSPTSPTLPTSYSKKRRVGSMKTDGSSNWVAFSQNGDEFLWNAPTQENNGITITTAPVTIQANVPTGLKVWVVPYVWYNPLVTVQAYVSSFDVADALPATGGPWNTSGLAGMGLQWQLPVRTNISGQYRFRVSVGSSSGLFTYTMGWIDRRGRDA